MKRWAFVLVAMLLLAAACESGEEEASSTTDQTTTTTTTTQPDQPSSSLPPVVVPGLIQTSFGQLASVPLVTDGDAYAGPPTPGSLDGVLIADWIENHIQANNAEDKLVENGFVVVPGTSRHFHHVYEVAAYEANPAFVTTDAAYHVWHLAFDKILREVEQQRLLPELESMLTRLVDLARVQEAELAGTDLAEAAVRVTQFYEAAATVLELDVGPIGPLAAAEVELIMAADEITLSPTTGGDADSPFITRQVDYTLFRPRGHYTRNEELERYFRAMSQLGNNAFLVDQGLLLGVLASRLILADEEVSNSWRLIYEPTAWLVGAADDYTPFELGATVDQVVSTGWDDPAVFAELSVVDDVATGLQAMRPVLINPEAASLRIMGARLVVDSYILDQLVMPNVADRWEASPLDLAAAFGSEWALATQEAAGKTAFVGYDQQMAVMAELIAKRTEEDWGATVYDSWLWALQPTWQTHGSEYPDYMQSEAWDAKAHQTGFGSYTELKHDTILYSKQAVAEGGGEELPPPRHWVEPEPVVFARLAAVTSLMRTGMEGRGLLPDQYSQLLIDLEDFYTWLAGIARDELSGVPISEEDNQQLSWIGSTLEGLWIRTSDADLDFETGPDSQAALIADVMRSAESGVLELGTGYVDDIFVLVPDNEGRFHVAAGAVYSYYEFWNQEQRLTDEEWRDQLEAALNPPRPDWQNIFLAGDTG